jgi:hypothetical protein
MASLIQSEICSILDKLKFELDGGTHPGAPMTVKVTKETIDFIKSLEGKALEVGADGKIAGL